MRALLCESVPSGPSKWLFLARIRPTGTRAVAASTGTRGWLEHKPSSQVARVSNFVLTACTQNTQQCAPRGSGGEVRGDLEVRLGGGCALREVAIFTGTKTMMVRIALFVLPALCAPCRDCSKRLRSFLHGSVRVRMHITTSHNGRLSSMADVEHQNVQALPPTSLRTLRPRCPLSGRRCCLALYSSQHALRSAAAGRAAATHLAARLRSSSKQSLALLSDDNSGNGGAPLAASATMNSVFGGLGAPQGTLQACSAGTAPLVAAAACKRS